ncbi:MAG: UDP-phosphate galactose phosphotransferase [Acidobacteria bacterium]|nr:MAG: UDP-phosphate galactose phosphotransferase [Acidobacteriota bacterium]
MVANVAQHGLLIEPSRIIAPTAAAEGNFYPWCKRCLDLVVSATLLVLLSPVMLLIAVLIKLNSPGSVLFTQARVGAKQKRSGKGTTWKMRTFVMYKFRSMVANASPEAHQAYIREFVEGRARPSSENGIFKLTNDPQVTRLGRVLRRFSLDELPQLFNVLKGDMSLVGPRPVPPYEVMYWQVTGRCRVSFEEMIRMDLDYIQRASLSLDLKILLLTIPAVLSMRGAE